MSYKLTSERSIRVFGEIHKELQELVLEVLKNMDISLIEGYRSLDRQYELFKEGKSHIDGMTRLGNHNHKPSRAVDIIPYVKGVNPFDGSKRSELLFDKMIIEFKLAALKLDIDISCGADWVTLVDKPHIELKNMI
jgi:hypothetical protein